MVLSTFGNLIFRPNTCLHFPDMRFLQQKHAKTRLPDSSTDGKRQFS